MEEDVNSGESSQHKGVNSGSGKRAEACTVGVPIAEEGAKGGKDFWPQKRLGYYSSFLNDARSSAIISAAAVVIYAQIRYRQFIIKAESPRHRVTYSTGRNVCFALPISFTPG